MAEMVSVVAAAGAASAPQAASQPVRQAASWPDSQLASQLASKPLISLSLWPQSLVPGSLPLSLAPVPGPLDLGLGALGPKAQLSPGLAPGSEGQSKQA